MLPRDQSCPHQVGTECVLRIYRVCLECIKTLPPTAEWCSCGATKLGPVLELCMCRLCEHEWTRRAQNNGYPPPDLDVIRQTVSERFAALACARGLLYAAVFRLEHDKTIPQRVRMRAGMKLLRAIKYVVNAAINEGERVN